MPSSMLDHQEIERTVSRMGRGLLSIRSQAMLDVDLFNAKEPRKPRGTSVKTVYRCPGEMRNPAMSDYRFSVIIPMHVMTHERNSRRYGCTWQCRMYRCVHPRACGRHGVAVRRTADSLQAAMSSAISDVEQAGFRVSKVELEREAIPG